MLPVAVARFCCTVCCLYLCLHTAITVQILFSIFQFFFSHFLHHCRLFGRVDSVTSYNVSSKRSDLSKGKLTISKQNELQEAFIRAVAARKTFDHLAPNCSTVKNSVVLAHLIEKVSCCVYAKLSSTDCAHGNALHQKQNQHRKTNKKMRFCLTLDVQHSTV
jgi:hypothetical protein